MKAHRYFLLTIVISASLGEALFGQGPQELALQKYSTNTVTQFPVGTNPTALCFDGTSIWVANHGSNNVTKLAPATGATIGTYPAGSGPYGICFDGANIWVANEGSHSITKINAATGATVGTFNVGNASHGICFDGTNIWAVCRDANTVVKLDAKTGALIGTYPVGNSPRGICFDGTNIWVANCISGTASQLDRATGASVKVWPAGTTPNAICYVPWRGIFVTNTGANAFSQIDYYQGLRTFKTPGTRPWAACAYCRNSSSGTSYGFWITYLDSNNVSQELNAPTYNVGNTPYGICFDGVNIWVANYGSNTVSKL